MKRKFFIVFIALVLLLLAGCKNSSADDKQVSADEPHTFAGYPVVYLTTDVSAKGLLAVYEALEPSAAESVAMKLSEQEDIFQWSELTKDLIQSTGEPSIVDLVDDPNYADYGSTIFLTHFHRHEAAGFHGTVANLASISSQTEETDSQPPNADELMKLLAERGNAAAETLKGQVLYIAVLDHFSIGNDSTDIAILSSYDPVSLDQACVDLVNMSEECQILALHIASCKGLSTLIQAEQMGLGSRTYAFLSIDN